MKIKKLKSNSAALETNSTALNCFNHAKKILVHFLWYLGKLSLACKMATIWLLPRIEKSDPKREHLVQNKDSDKFQAKICVERWERGNHSHWDWDGLFPRSVCSNVRLADLRRAQWCLRLAQGVLLLSELLLAVQRGPSSVLSGRLYALSDPPKLY